MQKLPEHGSCFVCGSANPHSMGVTWYADDQGAVIAEVVLSAAHQGPPGFAHGGASAALLDEAMGAAVWRAGFRVALKDFNASYHKPVKLGDKLSVIGKLVEQNGKVLYAQGELRLSDGTVAVTSRGMYVEAPQIFNNPSIPYEKWQG